jgi:hypothetical protein
MLTYEQALRAAQSGTINFDEHEWFTPEAIAERIVEQQSCVWHAAWSISMEHLDELGYGHCTLCGGRTGPGQDNLHPLCAARAEHGRPTPPLDGTPRCACARCRPDVTRIG